MKISIKLAKQWDRFRADWRIDPVAYAVQRLGVSPTFQQRKLLEALAPPGAKVSVRAGHGVGKTTALGIAVWWMLECFDFSKIPCTAPTASQLRDVLWSELAKLARLSDQLSNQNGLPRGLYLSSLFKTTRGKICDAGKSADEWFATARTALKEKPDALQGFHASDLMISADGHAIKEEGKGGELLFLIDEASGVPDEIYEAAEGALASPHSRLLMAGNPLRNSGYFAASHKNNRADYTALHFKSADSPLVDPGYRAGLVRKFGDGNVVRVRADGEFPTQDDDTLIPLELCEAALIRPPALVVPGQPKPPRILGIDVARFGDDRTVYTLRCGATVEYIEVRSKEDTMKTAGRAVSLWKELKADQVNVDVVGVGSGVCDRLREQGVPIVDVNVAEAAPQDSTPGSSSIYGKPRRRGEAVPFKLRDYLWLEVATWLREDSPSFAMADHTYAQDMAGELASVRYGLDSSGRLVVESKDAMKRRHLRSCDIADSLCVTFAPKKPFDPRMAWVG